MKHLPCASFLDMNGDSGIISDRPCEFPPSVFIVYSPSIILVVTSTGRRVLYDGPPANGVRGRRQVPDVLTTSLPNGRSNIVTSVTDGSGAVVGTSITNVIVEGTYDAGTVANSLPPCV